MKRLQPEYHPALRRVSVHSPVFELLFVMFQQCHPETAEPILLSRITVIQIGRAEHGAHGADQRQ